MSDFTYVRYQENDRLNGGALSVEVLLREILTGTSDYVEYASSYLEKTSSE